MRPNQENFFSYNSGQWDIVAHLTVLEAAVMGAAFVYFLGTKNQSAPRFMPSSLISAVVMVSAAFTAYLQYDHWKTAFQWQPDASGDGLWAPVAGVTFSNGFRYMNWSIDVPMLLLQLLFLVDLRPGQGQSLGWRLSLSGLGMIWTSYVAQLYETSAAGNVPGTAFYVWYGVSWACYVYLLWVLYFEVYRPAFGYMSPDAAYMMKAAWYLTLASWMVYPVAIIMPAIWPTAEGMVTRQALFSGADIVSKAVYGVVLTRVATLRSKEVGYGPAKEEDWPPQDFQLDGRRTQPVRQDGPTELVRS